MTTWPARRLVALLLSVFMIAGMGLSAVRSVDMTVRMAVAAGIGDLAHGGCQGCPDGEACEDTMACASAPCAAPVFGVPLQVEVAAASAGRLPASSAVVPLFGRAAVPDPYPPRPAGHA